MNNIHLPVMLKETTHFLNLKPGDVVLDATTGLGGHAKEILRKISPGGKLIGIDADGSALKLAGENLKDFSGSFKLINDNFKNLDAILSKEGVKSLDAILLDLGISSYQIEEYLRGFSIKNDARLDMRMDPRLTLTAHDIVNTYGEDKLADIIFRYGEERFSKRIAKFILQARSKKEIESTHELAGIIRNALGQGYRKKKIDPATKTFQAIRIAVNDELSALEEGLKKAVSWLDVGARICVISFHSLEDRIVKNLFKGYSDLGFLKIITKKPIVASEVEVEANPRSRSAKLRVAERV